jgi:hypothetical protein
MLSENWSRLSLTQRMDEFLHWFPKITKEDSDLIGEVCSWDDETRSAFMFAKRIFEQKD